MPALPRLALPPTAAQRPLSAVPRPILALLAIALAAQLAWNAAYPAHTAPVARDGIAALPPAPGMVLMAAASLGEREAASRLAMLYLQSWDDQPGAVIPWRALDYQRLADWLALASDLDPRSQYPLLAASDIYSAVNDPLRVRIMLDFVERRYRQDPQHRWPWLARAALAAHHRLHDPALAQRYARALRQQPSTPGTPDMPQWARELDTILAASELQATRVIAGGLLSGGQVRDAHEAALLDERLRRLARQPR